MVHYIQPSSPVRKDPMSPYTIPIWGVVKIMVPFWVLNTRCRIILRNPKKDYNFDNYLYNPLARSFDPQAHVGEGRDSCSSVTIAWGEVLVSQSLEAHGATYLLQALLLKEI